MLEGEVVEEQSSEKDFHHHKEPTSLDRPRSRAQYPAEHLADTLGSWFPILKYLQVGAWGYQGREGKKHYHEGKRGCSPRQLKGGWQGPLSFAVE